MKTKLLSIIIAAIAFLLPMRTLAYDFMVNGLCYNKNSDGTSVTVTYEVSTSNQPHYNNIEENLIIPASVTYEGQTYSVTAIGTDAFRYCSDITSVIIPNSVTTIGNGAFYFCTGLTSVTIPNSVTVIDMNAFRECSSLKNISIPNSVTKIGGDAFNNCKSMTNITIPNSVTSIGNGAFWSCISLTSMVVESGNTKYDSRDNCNAIVETATNTLFAGCQNTIIPNSVTSIGNFAFYGCSTLISLTIPNSITSIGTAAFFNCTGLEKIYSLIGNPSSVTLGSIVFSGVKAACILYVPKDTKVLYEVADQWKAFKIISEIIDITGLAFAKKSTIVDVGLTFLMEPIITPDDATIKEISWTSSDATVATVDDFGKVTTLKGGVTTITASTTDGTNLSASYDLYVIDRNILIDALIASGNVVTGNVNTEIMLPLIVRNGVDITSLSFTITLPEQVSLVDDINSFLVASERGENFTFTATQKENGSITINGRASKPLEIGVGEILSLKVKAQKQGTFTIPITDLTVTTVDGLVRPLLNSETKLIIQSVFGDLNGDGEVDIADVNTLIDIIYERY